MVHAENPTSAERSPSRSRLDPGDHTGIQTSHPIFEKWPLEELTGFEAATPTCRPPPISALAGPVAGKTNLSAQARASAKPAAVYQLLCSGRTWPDWSPIGSFDLEREGTDGGESLGAVRVFKTGTVRSREELVDLRPDKRLSYVALSGLPIRGHRADVELEEHDDGTTITWHEDFEAKVPGTGWLLGWFVKGFAKRCAEGLAAHASAISTATQP